MTQSFLGRRGIAVAPHSLASEAALRVLREGGNALEAMIAAAASIAVVYPHMNSIGGDGFWVIGGPSGAARGHRRQRRQRRGGDARALREARRERQHPVPRRRRGADGGRHGVGLGRGACAGARVGRHAAAVAPARGRALVRPRRHSGHAQPVGLHRRPSATSWRPSPGFAETFLVDGAAPAAFSLFRQPRLAATLAAHRHARHRGLLPRRTGAAARRRTRRGRQPADRRRPRRAPGEARRPADAGHPRRDAGQHDAALAGRGLADDPGHHAAPEGLGRRPDRRGLRACAGRGHQAGLRAARPACHRPGLHDASHRPRCCATNCSTNWPRTSTRSAPRPGAAAPTRATPCGWA